MKNYLRKRTPEDFKKLLLDGDYRRVYVDDDGEYYLSITTLNAITVKRYEDGCPVFFIWKYNKDKCKNNDGYHYLNLGGRAYLMHRVVAENFVYNPFPKEYSCVDHKDGDKDNNLTDNLEWVTYKENMRRAKVNGQMHWDKTRCHGWYSSRMFQFHTPEGEVVDMQPKKYIEYRDENGLFTKKQMREFYTGELQDRWEGRHR